MSTPKSYDKRYLVAFLMAMACTYAWHKGYPELTVAVVVMLLVLIFEKLDAGN